MILIKWGYFWVIGVIKEQIYFMWRKCVRMPLKMDWNFYRAVENFYRAYERIRTLVCTYMYLSWKKTDKFYWANENTKKYKVWKMASEFLKRSRNCQNSSEISKKKIIRNRRDIPSRVVTICHREWWYIIIALNALEYGRYYCFCSVLNVEKWLLLFLWFFLVWFSVKFVLKYFTLLDNFVYENVWESVYFIYFIRI